MNKSMSKAARTLVVLLAFLMLFSLVDVFGFTLKADALVESVNGSDSLVRTSLAEIKSVLTSKVYSTYINDDHKDVPNATNEIIVDIFNDINEEFTNATTKVAAGTDYGTTGDILLTGDDGKISFNVNIPSSGMYNIEIEYWTGNIVILDQNGEVISEGKSSSAERMVLINDKVPFKEARSITLTKSWVDNYFKLDENYKIIDKDDTYNSLSDIFNQAVKNNDRIFQNDNNGNEMKPDKLLSPIWRTIRLADSSGYYSDPLKFYFQKGTQVLTLSTVRETLAIKSIKLVPPETLRSYEEYIDFYSKQGAKDYSGSESYKIQAEYPTMTSDRTIYQLNDRTSVISEPQDPALVKLNSIGGNKWQYVGQWIEYQIEVPEDGFYTIVPRSKQDEVSGIYVSRKIYINGEIPFNEANYIRFNYTDKWQTNHLTDGDTNFKFFLKKGINTLKFEVALGNFSELLSTVESTMTLANTYYRKILMLTGPDPDEYRDYGFETIMPDVLKGLKACAKTLNEVASKIESLVGTASENTGQLLKAALNMERMGSYPDKIASTMSTLKDQLAALGSWLTSMQSQPLKLDYIVIQAVDAARPKADAGFIEKFVGEVKKFFYSFFADYNSVSSTVTEEAAQAFKDAGIEVWTFSSRDHAQIIRNLVDD
ncbi:hypothetical protein LJB90_03985, partial [Eubacteriales bacterium OttesenSCG-928-G02]|nr:hypothetical protein [Eubacteriales bacterium OttesenSCG-928-G02]